MRFRLRVVAAAALASGSKGVSACSCRVGKTLCDKFGEATVVLKGEVLSSETFGSDINDEIVYRIHAEEVFKGEAGVDYEFFDFVTAGNSGDCGITMAEGEDYLIDLRRRESDGQLRAIGFCGLNQHWRGVSIDDLELLREGCASYDPCDGTCGEYQECNFFSIASYGETEYYCSDSCDDPSQCADEGTCELTYEFCEDFTRPCPATASCAPPAALPASLCATCGDYQECLVYTDVGGTEVRYCADTCDDENQCDEGETCILEEQVCVADPCPSVARCVPDEETAYEEVGCFKDTRHDRVLGSQYDSPEMSAEVCLEHCKQEGAAYMATQYGYECWCYVNGRADFDRHGDGAVCDIPCQGNESENCGGFWAFTLYKLDWPDSPEDNPEYEGCFRDTWDERVLTYPITLDDMTPESCRDHCLTKEGATYYATQFGNECWCEMTDSSDELVMHGEGVCHIPCAGEESISCGGSYAFDLFKLDRDGSY